MHACGCVGCCCIINAYAKMVQTSERLYLSIFARGHRLAWLPASRAGTTPMSRLGCRPTVMMMMIEQIRHLIDLHRYLCGLHKKDRKILLRKKEANEGKRSDDTDELYFEVVNSDSRARGRFSRRSRNFERASFVRFVSVWERWARLRTGRHPVCCAAISHLRRKQHAGSETAFFCVWMDM